jgi:lysophospholipase L1-like esterase
MRRFITEAQLVSLALLAFEGADIAALCPVFPGDLITDGNLGGILGQGYAFLMAAKYGATFPERHLTLLNRGTSGNTGADLKARWQTDTLDLKPTLPSVLIGINDVKRRVSAEVLKPSRATTRLSTTPPGTACIPLIPVTN